MKRTHALLALAACFLFLLAACDCGGSPPANTCGVNTCGACEAGCSATDRCEASGWVCECTCADGGAGGDAGVADGGDAGAADGGDAGVTDGGAGGGDGGGADGGGGLDAGDGDAGIDGGVTPTNVCLDIATRKCDFEIRCRSENDHNQGRANDRVAASERARCVAGEASKQDCLVAAEGWELGRATLDKTAYFACFDSVFPSNTCARDLNLAFASCTPKQFITPATAVGNLCTSDTECVSGYCSVNAVPACGICIAYAAISGACTRDAMCNPATSYCPMADGTAGTCTGYLAQGATCTRRIDKNAQDEVCGPGRICSAAAAFSASGTCEIGLAENAPCVKGAWQCQRSARSVVPSLVCATIGGTDKCVKTGNTTAGGQCNTGEVILIFQTPVCLETEFCSGGSCFARKDAGVTCASGQDQCLAGMRCVGNGSNAHCEAYEDLDATCGNSNECLNFLSCQTAQCKPSHALIGEGCSGTVTCSEGFCDTTVIPNVCAALKGVDAGCSADPQCQSFKCNTAAGTPTCLNGCWQ